MRLERQPFVARSPRNYNRPADALFSPPGGEGKPRGLGSGRIHFHSVSEQFCTVKPPSSPISPLLILAVSSRAYAN